MSIARREKYSKEIGVFGLDNGVHHRATLIEWIVGFAIDSIAGRADLSFIEFARLDTKQLKACLGNLERLPPMPSFADKVDLGERIIFIDSVTMLQRKGPGLIPILSGDRPESKNKKGDDTTARREAWFFAESLHWDPIFRDANRWFDRMTTNMRTKDRTERKASLKKLNSDLIKLKEDLDKVIMDLDKVLSWGTLQALFWDVDTLSKKIGDIMICLLMPPLDKVNETGDLSEQIHRNVRVAFALAMYKSDEGRYPPKLDALTPRYLLQVPNDLFSGKELIYRPTDAGYLLYSVGVNGQDDQGRTSDDTPPADDLPVRMPSARPKTN